MRRRSMKRSGGLGFGRGVWMAPWLGPNGETILVAVTRDRKLIGEPAFVPAGGNHVKAADDLWERLDADDPIPNLKLV
jgi:hypothetical protein